MYNSFHTLNEIRMIMKTRCIHAKKKRITNVQLSSLLLLYVTENYGRMAYKDTELIPVSRNTAGDVLRLGYLYFFMGNFEPQSSPSKC